MGNEKANALSQADRRVAQCLHSVVYRESKTTIHNAYRSQWIRRLSEDIGVELIHQQTILVRLRLTTADYSIDSIS